MKKQQGNISKKGYIEVSELCPNCDEIITMKVKKGIHKTVCPNCGGVLILCSLCDMDKVDCRKCEFGG